MQHESLSYNCNRKTYPPYFGDYLILHKFNQHFLNCEQLDIDDNRIYAKKKKCNMNTQSLVIKGAILFKNILIK